MAKSKIITLGTAKSEEPVKEQENLSEEELKKQEREKMLELINDPNVKANGLTVAKDFHNTFRGNWFDVPKIQKKTDFKDINQAVDVLNILCLLGLAYRKLGDKGEIKYKITLNNKAKIALLEDNIVEAEKQIADYKAEIERLKQTS